MPDLPFHIVQCATSDDTARLAGALAAVLRPGDTVLLAGNIGAGKTHFARSVIHALQGPGSAEDVPSPTFTIVQTYDSPRGEIWHTDLYRLSDLSEVFELGLEEAFETAICLVEWPDRLGDMAPQDSLWLTFATRGETARDIAFSGPAPWPERLGLTP